MNEGYYLKILGFEKGQKPSLDEIKKRYRELAIKYHPDKISDHTYFQMIKDAYEYFFPKVSEEKDTDEKVVKDDYYFLNLFHQLEGVIINSIQSGKVSIFHSSFFGETDDDQLMIVIDRNIDNVREEIENIKNDNIQIQNYIRELKRNYKSDFKLIDLLAERIQSGKERMKKIKKELKYFLEFKKYVLSYRKKKRKKKRKKNY